MCRLPGEYDLGVVERLLGVLLGGELADHASDLVPPLLGALLRGPRPQIGDQQNEVLDRTLQKDYKLVYNMYLEYSAWSMVRFI